jgi:hypothetical protein
MLPRATGGFNLVTVGGLFWGAIAMFEPTKPDRSGPGRLGVLIESWAENQASRL